MADTPTVQELNGANGTTPLPPLSVNGTSLNMTTSSAAGLSADEFAQYDRQIRLWGAQAQERIRSAHILLISLRALGTEIAKNLTLAGISSLTIIDDGVVTEEDLGAQYFLREEDIGQSRAESAIARIQELNPRVNIKSDGSLNDLLQKDQTYYAPFSCIIACDHDFMTLSMINTASRVAQRPFYAAGIHGFYGYIFADLFGHEFVIEREKSNVPTQIGPETLTRAVLDVTSKREGEGGKTKEIVKKQEIYCPLILANSSPLPMEILNNRRKLKSVPALLPCLRALFDFQRAHGRLPGHSQQDLGAFTSLATTKSRELLLPPETLRADFLRSFIQNIGAEIVPTAAFVGGRLSEDVINVLGMREQPIQNFALFDGEGLDGRIYCLYSTPPELTMPMGAGPMGGMSNGMDGMEFGMGVGLGMGADSIGMGADFGLVDGAGFMPQNGMGLDGVAGLRAGEVNMGTDMGMAFDLPVQSVSGATQENIPAEVSAPIVETDAAEPTTAPTETGVDGTSAAVDVVTAASADEPTATAQE